MSQSSRCDYKKNGITRFYLVVICAVVLGCGCSSNTKAFFSGAYLVYNDVDYIETGGRYIIDKKIGTTDDGWVLYSIMGDESNNYLEVSSFLDNYLYVRKDYVVDTNNLEAIWFGSINGYYTENEDIVKSIINILQKK